MPAVGTLLGVESGNANLTDLQTPANVTERRHHPGARRRPRRSAAGRRAGRGHAVDARRRIVGVLHHEIGEVQAIQGVAVDLRGENLGRLLRPPLLTRPGTDERDQDVLDFDEPGVVLVASHQGGNVLPHPVLGRDLTRATGGKQPRQDRHQCSCAHGGSIAAEQRVASTRASLQGRPRRWTLRPMNRLCFAAAHLVFAESYRTTCHRLQQPGRPDEIAEHIDWSATMALRTRLDEHGFGTAEAMDTAQRFFVGWPVAQQLIERTGALRLTNGFVAGAGTDHLDEIRGADDLVAGVVEQCEWIRRHGGIPTILPMPWLALQRRPAQDYVDTYCRIFDAVEGPVFVHWLGEMFLPVLRGYFPDDSFDRVMAARPDVARGCKLSLLDADLEVSVRRRLLERDQVVLTGDDFHFARMILGGSGETLAEAPPVVRYTKIGAHRVALGDFSHALLGIFDGIAGPAGQALQALAAGDVTTYLQQMEPLEDLSRVIFETPTQHYKAGLALLAWLSGAQDNMMLANREELARDHAHFERVIALARGSGVLADHPRLAERMTAFAAGHYRNNGP
jgi:hypothetical protein